MESPLSGGVSAAPAVHGPTPSRVLAAAGAILLEPSRIALRIVGVMQIVLAVLTAPAFNVFSNIFALACGSVLVRNFSEPACMEAFLDSEDSVSDSVTGMRAVGDDTVSSRLSGRELGSTKKRPKRGCCCAPGHANSLAILTIFAGCFEIAGLGIAMWQLYSIMPQLLIFNILNHPPYPTLWESILWHYATIALFLGAIAPFLHISLAMIATTTYDSFRNATIEVRAQQAAAAVLDARLTRQLVPKKSGSRWANLTRQALADRGITTPRSILAAVQAVAAEELATAAGKIDSPEQAVSRILGVIGKDTDDVNSTAVNIGPKPSFAALLAAAKERAPRTSNASSGTGLRATRSVVVPISSPGAADDPIPRSPVGKDAERGLARTEPRVPGTSSRRRLLAEDGSFASPTGGLNECRRSSLTRDEDVGIGGGAILRKDSAGGGGLPPPFKRLDSNGSDNLRTARDSARVSDAVPRVSGSGTRISSGAASLHGSPSDRRSVASEKSSPMLRAISSLHLSEPSSPKADWHGPASPKPDRRGPASPTAASMSSRPPLHSSQDVIAASSAGEVVGGIDKPVSAPYGRASAAAVAVPPITAQGIRANAPLHDRALMVDEAEMPYDLYDMVVTTARTTGRSNDELPPGHLGASGITSASDTLLHRQGSTTAAAASATSRPLSLPVSASSASHAVDAHAGPRRPLSFAGKPGSPLPPFQQAHSTGAGAMPENAIRAPAAPGASPLLRHISSGNLSAAARDPDAAYQPSASPTKASSTSSAIGTVASAQSGTMADGRNRASSSVAAAAARALVSSPSWLVSSPAPQRFTLSKTPSMTPSAP